MLVEVSRQGKTHEEQACAVAQPCTAQDQVPAGLLKGYCLNCGWRPDHVQETGAEIVIHRDWEGRDLKWYDEQLRLRTLAGMTLALSPSTSGKSGSCNCCDEHITEKGMTPHSVTILTVGYDNRTASLRLCNKCFQSLKTLVDLWPPNKG